DHLPPEVARPEDQVGRDLPVADDVLPVVDVLEKRVEGRNPLAEAALEGVPLLVRNHPRDEVEGKDALRPLGLAVHGERDSLVEELDVRLAPPLLEDAAGELQELVAQRLV